jgi:alkylated DNA repair dioxygenase AlkB
MNDLFGSSTEAIDIPLPDASLKYWQNIYTPISYDAIVNEFISVTQWKAEEVVIYGKRYLQPRLVAWFGDEGVSYSYSGIKLAPNPWTELLSTLKEEVERLTGHRFNSVLLNYYRDEKDSMGFHSDDERELGNSPIIASLSFGEVRTLIFKPKLNKGLKSVKLPLESGSLLLMQGETQKNWVHGIEKEKKPCGPRVNLTFRKIF